MSRFAHLFRAELADLKAYVPEAGAFDVRLDANESPQMLSDDARTRLARAIAPEAYNRYPDARATDLRRAIAERMDAEPDEIVAGVGTDEVIALLLTALDRPREKAGGRPSIVTTSPTFVMYRLSGKARGFQVVEVPLDASWDLDVAAMKRAIEFARPNIVFVATPNNPTGALMTRARLEQVIQAAGDALVVVDEAYVDFARASQLDLRRAYPNVAILRTLSKVGFAALRVGWLVGPREVIEAVDKVRQPYNLPMPSQRAAALVLRELWGEVGELAKRVIAARDALAASLRELGYDVAPSDANFLWVGTRRPASEVFEALRARGVLVRSFHAAGGRLATRLRVTVGLPEENARLLRELGAIG